MLAYRPTLFFSLFMPDTTTNVSWQDGLESNKYVSPPLISLLSAASERKDKRNEMTREFPATFFHRLCFKILSTCYFFFRCVIATAVNCVWVGFPWMLNKPPVYLISSHELQVLRFVRRKKWNPSAKPEKKRASLHRLVAAATAAFAPHLFVIWKLISVRWYNSSKASWIETCTLMVRPITHLIAETYGRQIY